MITYTTPETDAAQQAQRTTSKASAFVIAGVIHAVLLGVFLVWKLGNLAPPAPELIVQSTQGVPESRQKLQTLNQMAAKDKPSSSSAQMARLITAKAASPVQVPEAPTLDVETIGIGDGFGDGFGSGIGGAGLGLGGGMPQGNPMRDRCSKMDRKRRLIEGGGDDSTEGAVVKSLQWFKGRQGADGSWGGQHKVAMTGLALLVYLGHCETIDSKEYGETVHKAIVYLVDKGMADDGRIRSEDGRHWPYEHGIATYALCEAYTLHKYAVKKLPYMEQLKGVITKAVPVIIKGQNYDGGWVYSYEGSDYWKTLGDIGGAGRSPGDMSITGWQMQALKAATLTELEFSGIKKCIDDGIEFVQSYQWPDGSFSYRNKYQGGGDSQGKYSLTGTGSLCQQMFGKGGSSVSRAIRFILKHPFKWGDEGASLYGWYYGTQACFQRGSEHTDWKKWNGMFRDAVVNAQNEDGSWPFEGGGGGRGGRGGGGGPDTSNAAGGDDNYYRNALLTLMLEVYYRYLPATEK